MITRTDARQVMEIPRGGANIFFLKLEISLRSVWVSHEAIVSQTLKAETAVGGNSPASLPSEYNPSQTCATSIWYWSGSPCNTAGSMAARWSEQWGEWSHNQFFRFTPQANSQAWLCLQQVGGWCRAVGMEVPHLYQGQPELGMKCQSTAAHWIYWS